MNRIETRIDTSSDPFAENRAAYDQLLDTLRERQQYAIDGGRGRERSIQRHLDRGKVMVRDRIDLVTDNGTPFLEFSTLAGWGQYDNEVPGAGIVTGIGLVHGVPWVFIANDATVKGGSLVPMAIKKHVRAQDIALENGLGVIYLVDSGGAFLPLQDEIFPDKDHFGGGFYRQARMSAQGLPQLSVVLGPCTAGGAYVPALSDEVIMVEGIGRIFLGGPPIVKAALGEIVDQDELGGAVKHTRVSGVSDYLAQTEREAYGKLREICETVNQRRVTERQGWFDWQEPEEPAFPAEDLYGIISADDRIPFDATEIIARLVDGSRFAAFKPEWGESIVTGFARIHGHMVGIIANNGIIFSESALKAAHFIELCEQRRIPLLFLQNTSGYMVGSDSEAGGIAKNGAKMVAAVANATVPKYTVLIGGSYGAGNYGMSGRAFGNRFTFLWPTAKIAVMGPKQIAGVMSLVRRGQAARQGIEFDEEEDAKLVAAAEEIQERNSLALYATGAISDDSVIDPRDTRTVLAICLSVCRSAELKGAEGYGVFRL